MEKKKYIYPSIEILPFCTINALCSSGGSGDSGTIGGGGDPESGRAPRRTGVF